MLLLIGVLILIGGLSVAVLYAQRESRAQTQGPVVIDQGNKEASKEREFMTVSGKIECLPHKDTSGPVDMMCAIGIEADDGTHYALRSDDATLAASVPTGRRVQVEGTFTAQTSQYDSLGVIEIMSLKTM